MKLLYIIPFVLAVLVFILVLVLKNNKPREKSIYMLRVTGILFSSIAVVAILLSYYYSGDKAQLYKLSIPALILLMLIVQIKQKRNQ